jgi:lysophospholipase L1-like esterase
LFSAVLIVKTDFIPKVKAKLGVAATPSPHVSKMVRYHQWMDESVPNKATIFLGDSITQGLATAAVAPYSINYGIGGENTAQLLEAIPSYKSLARVNAIVLAIGINDLSQGMKVGLNDRYEKIVEALPNKIPLIWSAVMPARNEKIALSDINNANQTIKTLCSNRGNCVFVDTWSLLADKSGQMNSDLFLDDGVHLSPEGYRAWIPALKQAIQDISPPIRNVTGFATPSLTFCKLLRSSNVPIDRGSK